MTTMTVATVYDKPVTVPGPWESIAAVRAANQAAGQYWFTPDTMRFFHSRVEGGLRRGRLFVTSECREPGETPRLYTIRAAMDDASIETVGEFQAYRTLIAARNAIDRLVG